jgi:hypothetical protein
MKTCKTCGTPKPADAQHFPEYLTRHGNVSLRGSCLDCTRKAARERMARLDVEQKRAAKRKHRASDGGRAQHARLARETNAKRAGFERHEQWLASREHQRAVKQLAVAINQVRLSKREAEIRAKPWNAPGLTVAEAFRIRYRMDEDFRIGQRIRRQITKRAKRDGIGDIIRAALKRDGSSSVVVGALGYTIAELRMHLERQFLDGMGWHNMGEWHIDHITPQRLFDLSSESEWRKCWCMSNLRPMWARDNLTKSGRVEFLL